MYPIRILLTDDHETVRAGLRLLIDAQPEFLTVGEAADGNQAIALARELNPDVVVMDISMPGLNGAKATRRIVENSPTVKVVALTRHNERGYVQNMLDAGVAAYVLKQSASQELVRAIHAVVAGQTYLDPAITARVLAHYSPDSGVVDRLDRPAITDREAEVLRLIAQGYSNKEIAARLNISVKTVEAHKANSMHKLEFSSRIDIVNYALLRGWLNEQ